ncbi:hypothetical protein ACH5RR_024207 [Cinchona calisaya]|uniref:U-box domain-containing protein n=1 Tax=Cinchona calisaya TaxID=153742 RepID=A0ABD2ZGA1_9GENT
MDSNTGDVPPLFICPISLEIMKDPVTISTGMTYDRESIHKWLFQYKHNTCPVTKQTLLPPDHHHFLTPNSNLLRLIESWTLLHNQKLLCPTKFGSQNQVGPCSDIKLDQLVQSLKQSETLQRKCIILRKIKLVIQESDVLADSDDHIASLVTWLQTTILDSTDDEAIIRDHDHQSWEIIEEAVSVLECIKLPGEKLKQLAQDINGKMIALLSSIIVQQERSYQARINSASLLKSIFRVVDDIYKAELKIEMFEGIAEILKDQNSIRGSMAVLLILIEVLLYGDSGKKAVEVGIVPILIELLSETNERRMCEVLLHVLNQFCKGAEGRAAFLDHPAAVAAVSSKILRISHVVNDRAVKILSLLFRFSCETSMVAKELLEVGGVAKMCLVVQTHCSSRTKDNAKAILGFYHKSSIDYSCLPSFINKN